MEESEAEDEEDDETAMNPDALRDRANLNSLFHRLSSERVPVRVHLIIIQGNNKTKNSLIEAEVEPLFRDVDTFLELLRAAAVARAHLHALGIFDSVTITLDDGPPELRATANIIFDVSEGRLLSGDSAFIPNPRLNHGPQKEQQD